jgi:prepilin-type N-terminal cleavage/methylation domain-containing protein
LFRCLEDEAGYSLVEVMVSIMILAVAIIPMVGMFDMGLKSATTSGNYDRARAIAHEELEEIRALPFSGTPSSVVEVYPPGGGPRACTGPIATGFTCQVETTYVRVGPVEDPRIVPDSSARTMLEVRVTVAWDGGGKSYLATGLIAKETRCASGC